MRSEPISRWRTALKAAAMVVAIATAALALGCRQDMHDQPRYKPFAASALFADGSSAQRAPQQTVARGELADDRVFATGRNAGGAFVETLPVELSAALLDRGRERYEIYCTPCHDRTGSGRGMIVQRGFQVPPSYHTDRLRGMPIGYFYDVISNGFGAMAGYGSQVKQHDRWAIAAWIRVLQLSQHLPVSELPAAEVEKVEAGVSLTPAHEEAGHGGGSAGAR